MTLKGGTSQACARCKYQRRKCTSECPLAPYFPPDQPKIFHNAHRLFGVSNILKIIKDLDQNQKTEAMRSIIFQSNMRERFPVHGCFGIIMQYQYEIRQLEHELHVVQTQLAFYQQQQHEMLTTTTTTTTDEMSQKLQLGITSTPNVLTLFDGETIQPCDHVTATALPISSHPFYPYNANDVSNACYTDSKDENVVNSFWLQQPCNSDYNQIAIQTQSMVSEPLTTQGVVQNHELLDTNDDRQSYIDSKQTYESSPESSLKDIAQTLEQVAEDELKKATMCFSLAEDELRTAAARLSLTSVN